VIAGVEQKAHFMAFDLPHSDDCFVQAFPGRDDGGLSGRPCARLRVLRRRADADSLRQHQAGRGADPGRWGRQKTRAFSELQSHYLFAEKFGRPAKGNDKGKVENLVGYARRNFMVPIPRAASWEDAQRATGIHDAMARRAQRLRGHKETIGERFERDRAALLPLPAARFEACDKTTVRVSSISLVRYRTNDYSVPTQFGHRQVLVKAYVHHVVIVCGSEVIAEHRRSYEREATVYDPLHYLACSNTRAGSGPGRAAWPDGSCPSASLNCAGCWRRGCASTPPASTSRCCGCWRPSLFPKKYRRHRACACG
jgi:hypothetical protein